MGCGHLHGWSVPYATAAALDTVGLGTATFALLNVVGARAGAIQRELKAARRLAEQAERRQLLTLLRRALAAAPPQPPWRADEQD
jgi:hypothetical protein